MSNSTKYLSYEGLSHFKDILESRYEKKGHTHSYVPIKTVTFTPAETAIGPTEVLSKLGSGYALGKGTWDYAGNGYISKDTTGSIAIDLAGCSVIQFGGSSAYTQLYITAPASTTTNSKPNEMLFYNNHGSSYSPAWTRVLTNKNYSEYCASAGHTHNTLTIKGIAADTTHGDYMGILQNANVEGLESNTWYNVIKILHNNSAGYYTEFAQSFTGTEGLYHRRMSNGTKSNWRHVLDSVNYSSYALPVTGGSLTGPLVFNGTDTDRNIIRINNGTGDATTKSYFGFTLKYLGSGTGNENALALYSDNQTATSQIQIAKILQDGTLNSRNILPISNNTYSLGNSTLKWANVYATTFTGALSGNAYSATYININNSATSGDFPLTFVSSTNTGNQGLYVSTGKSLTFNPSTGNLKATTLYENGTSLVNKYAQISDCFIIKRDGTDNLTAAQITSYADLSTSSTGQSAFKLLKSGSYNVARSGSSELLINLGTNTGSASALEFLTNYTHTSRLKVRKIIDSNRVSGEFKELAWYSDIPTIPTSLPANGGNADTVDNKHASDFVLKAGDTMTGSLTTNNFLKITAPASDGTPTRNASIIRSEVVSSDANKTLVHIGSNYGYISVNENNIAKPTAHVDAIGIYRGVIGVGGTFTYDTLKSNQSNNISLEAVGKVKALSFIENGQPLSDKYQLKGNFAAASHGNHVPATQTANNKVFLRNDNTWQTITPTNIGAAETIHNHDTLTPDDIDDMFEQDFGIIFQ